MKQSMRSLFLITLPLATLGSLAPLTTVRAQIAPDNTLGAENSVVTPNQVINGTPSDRIDGGATRGANLFHSFREFNINEGRGAYFSNPAVIENIFSRVTGGNPSNILGRLGVLGNANLFFINPNGIIFGPNARLDLNGSFLGSTANSLIFDNGFRFSASNPQAPPLLTVNIPIGLRFRDNPSGITVRGLGHEGFDQNNQLVGAAGSFPNPTLEVPAGQNLALVGGNVNLEGGVLQAPGGQVELGGLAAAGEVGLNNGSLSFPDSVARADVSLTNRAGINVITDAFGGGSIDINARNIGISGSSLLTAGIASDLGEIDTIAGDITLNATGETRIDQSRIENNVNSGTIADSRNINIQTGLFVLINQAQLNASNLDDSELRAAGDVIVNASGAVTVDRGAAIFSDGFYGRIFLTSSNNSVNINNALIQTASDNAFTDDNRFNSIKISALQGSVFLNNAEINTSNSGTGYAGDILINARDQISITNSQIFAQGNRGRILIGDAQSFAPRLLSIDGAVTALRIDNRTAPDTDAGSIELAAGKVEINQATLSSSTFGSGKAGNITVDASGSVEFVDNALFSNVEAGAIDGQAGDITINADSLSLRDGAQLQSSVVGSSDDNLQGGQGNGGNVKIDVQGNVTIAGSNSDGESSAIFTDVESRASGDAGNITITSQAGSLLLDNGAQLYSTNESTGLAGNVTLNARDGKIEIVGSSITSTSNNANTNLYSLIDIAAPQGSVFLNDAEIDNTNSGTGFAGDVKINARDQVSLTNKSTISSNGLSGRILIGKNNIYQDATYSLKVVSLDGSTLSTTNRSVTGAEDMEINAGDISIDASDRISLVNGSKINAFTQRLGNAGSVTLQAENGEISLADQSSILSTVEAGGIGNGGNINLSSRDLTLRRNSDITTNATASGTGGNITIDADFLVAYPDKEDGSDITADAANGPGGNIDITANRVFGIQVRDEPTENNDITAISEFDPSLNGNIDLNTPDVDPSRGLVELPENVVDPAAQIAQNPCQQGVGSQFIVTGRGGLPPNPNQALSSDNVLVDLVEGGSREQGAGSRKVGEQRSAGVSPAGAQERTTSTPSVPKPVVPAQGWVFNEKGEVVLTAYNPNNTGSQRPWQTPASCAAPNR